MSVLRFFVKLTLPTAVILFCLPLGARAASTFSASAGGEIVRFSLKLQPALLQEDLLDPSAVTAQASLTSFGESSAFASHPYPGSVVVAGPGLVDGLLGSTAGVPPELAALINVPEYPLVASSSHPSVPESGINAGSIELRAESEGRRSEGVASDGLNRTVASVTADESDVVTATASTTVGSLDFGSALQIGGLRGAATVTQGAGGDLTRTTEFTVASIMLLGQQLQITEDGLQLGGTVLQLGLDVLAEPLQSLLDAASESGVAIRFLEQTDTPTGVVSAGLEVTRTFDTGVNGILATVAATYGRTFASVDNEARGSLDTGTMDGAPGNVTGSLDPSDASLGVDITSGLPIPAAQPAARPATAPVPGPNAQTIRALVPDVTDLGAFYPLMVGGGVVLFVGVSIFRKIGRAFAWTS